jgi:hypothetical protein
VKDEVRIKKFAKANPSVGGEEGRIRNTIADCGFRKERKGQKREIRSQRSGRSEKRFQESAYFIVVADGVEVEQRRGFQRED